MTTTTSKRPAESEGEHRDIKKSHTEDSGSVLASTTEVSSVPEALKSSTVLKGVAAIKAEYIISNPTIPIEEAYINDDEAEGGDRGTEAESERGGKKGKKRRGQNKKRDNRQQHEEVRLCTSLINPQEPKPCSFGAGNCRNCHDIELYLASKLEDIEGPCPVYSAIGYCPAGLKCRWLHSHYNKETKELLKDMELIQKTTEANDNFEVNKISSDLKTQLQRKKYDFTRATEVTAYLDTHVQNDTKQDLQKETLQSYHESVFKPAEKKKLNLKNTKIVSPLTTVGNLPYRRLMRTLGADITYSEMALTIPLLQGTNSEWALPKAHNSEYPGFGVQIAASKHWAASKAAEAIYKECGNVSELNLNCGCPIDLLYRQGQGSALMEQPPKLIRILKGMNLCSGDIPVTVKLRTGIKDGKNVAKPLIDRLLKEEDVAAITLHGRTKQQRYTKEADWNYIGEVAQVVQNWNDIKADDKDRTDIQPTAFVGNGDIYTHEDWYKATSIPGVDSVMVARGALIKPWIFEEVEAQQYLDKSALERLEILKTFSHFALEHWGSDEYGVGQARRFMCEFMSFTHRYIPVGILERLPPKINERPPMWRGRNEMETLLGSGDYQDWIKITEMFLGKVGTNFQFTPKHKSNAYEKGT
ncbi:tRNA-dihydrouridine synthase 3 [Scheffersomyces spartinae]|uniref:tRNA-dihydrouridine(47) synthase [NAD(P)(+)] n=1 Tax=Scheffersomyces spartinae TaxID=45513 RepID=A0A9P8AKE7_9ASCO|nr:tRNA-dihydrouridine synthase 3 [Scheffersomyces spartinae]KAG7195827.1 tRNA-dihydrouridine synthase 3 [Scheffersomyces spartinae]